MTVVQPRPPGASGGAPSSRTPRVWAWGNPRDPSVPLRDFRGPPPRRVHPLTRWLLFDQPVRGLRLCVAGAPGDRSVWLTVDPDPTDARATEDVWETLSQGLSAVRWLSDRSRAGRRPPPNPLPAHRAWLHRPRAAAEAPARAYAELVPAALCDLVEGLTRRDNRAVVTVTVDLSARRLQLAEALEHVEAAEAKARVRRPPPSRSAASRTGTVDDPLPASRRLLALAGRFGATVALHTERAVDPLELRWTLRQLEGRVHPIGSWSPAPPPPCPLDALALDSVVRMLWADERPR